MQQIKKNIKLDKHDLEIIGRDERGEYSVSVYWKGIYIPPTFNYKYSDYINVENSFQSGLLFGTLQEIVDEIIDVVIVHSGLRDKLNKLDNKK